MACEEGVVSVERVIIEGAVSQRGVARGMGVVSDRGVVLDEGAALKEELTTGLNEHDAMWRLATTNDLTSSRVEICSLVLVLCL